MTGKERLLCALQRKKPDRTPWLPFVGCHGAKLLNVEASAYLQSGQLIEAGVKKAIECYRPDGLPVVFDLQLEAEAMGCELIWSPENPPAVASHPLAEGARLDTLRIPSVTEGRIGMTMQVARNLTVTYPDLAWYGLITGPFTLALHLMGTDIFMKMIEEPDSVIDTLAFAEQVAITMAAAYLDAGCDVIALVDPMTSQIDASMFQTFISDPVSNVFRTIRERGKLSSFFVCGDAQQNIEVMCQTRPDNLSIDENIPLAKVAEIASSLGVSYGGNLKLTTTLLMGQPDDVRRNVIECLDAATYPGFILSPGCDLPMATPVENLQVVNPLIEDPFQLEVHRQRNLKSVDAPLLDLSDYGHGAKVQIDVITLDSASCAPCQYMVEAVKVAASSFGNLVEWREHSIKQESEVIFMRSLQVQQIPSICIDGKLAYSSRIPPIEKLVESIQQRISEKTGATAIPASSN